ncbi:MAG TPA: Na+/H+ antiporter, partial [Chloroflexia bacterium]|nr:Na+/H+ antiporter [Chloroflexia bacterium]
FGAIVSPPDAVAAAAVFRGLGVPRRVVTLLDGESLVNDATALVAYRAALGAAAVAFSAAEAGMRFVVVSVGSLLVGLVIAWLIGQVERRLDDPPVEITLSLLTPFATYLVAESFGLSGVLATVVAGLYLGWQGPYLWQSDARLRGRAVWDMVDYILNGLVFILIGLQLSTILPTLSGQSLVSLLGLGLVLSSTVILVRLVWIFLEAYLPDALARVWPFHPLRHPGRQPHPPRLARGWRKTFVIGWAGMRGVVSLAAVLALPEATPQRDLLIFLTFFVILATLVGQGLSLPWLIRRLGVTGDRTALAHREVHARQMATEAALARLEQLRDEWPMHLPLIDTLRAQYDHRASHLDHTHHETDTGGLAGAGSAQEVVNQELLEHHRIRRAVLGAERAAVLDLRRRGEIEDEVWRQIERDLDLEELRMDA